MSTKLTEIHILRSVILCETGLHIGGSSQKIEIAGVDLPVVKHPITGEPYIPGSSLKGKMRSSLEKKLGKFGKNGTEPCGCGMKACLVCTIFGAHKNTNPSCGTTRILVRDAQLTEAQREKVRAIIKENRGTFLEVKTENIINRSTGTAEHPRDIERVPAGIEFDLEIVMQIYEGDPAEEFKRTVEQALDLVEQTYLGGMGSRGYGKVKFKDRKWTPEQEA